MIQIEADLNGCRDQEPWLQNEFTFWLNSPILSNCLQWDDVSSPSLQIDVGLSRNVLRCFKGFDRDYPLESWRWCCEERHEGVFWSRKPCAFPPRNIVYSSWFRLNSTSVSWCLLFQPQKPFQICFFSKTRLLHSWYQRNNPNQQSRWACALWADAGVRPAASLWNKRNANLVFLNCLHVFKTYCTILYIIWILHNTKHI